MVVHLVTHSGHLAHIAQDLLHGHVPQIQADRLVTRLWRHIEDEIDACALRVKISAAHAQQFGHFIQSRPAKVHLGKNQTAELFRDLFTTTLRIGCSRTGSSEHGTHILRGQRHLIFPGLIHRAEHLGALLIIRGLEVALAISFHSFHPTSGGAVVGINAQNVLVGLDRAVVVTEFPEGVGLEK